MRLKCWSQAPQQSCKLRPCQNICRIGAPVRTCFLGSQKWGWAAPGWELRSARLGLGNPSCPSLRHLPPSPARPRPSWPLPRDSALVTEGEIQPGYKQAKLNEVNLHTGLLVLPANLESLAGSVTSVTLDFITLDISMRVTHSPLKCIVCMSKDD